jgi:hypothetical protein
MVVFARGYNEPAYALPAPKKVRRDESRDARAYFQSQD